MLPNNGWCDAYVHHNAKISGATASADAR